MKEQNKRKKQLIDELMELRQRIIELEALANERKRAEEALKSERDKFRGMFSAISDGVDIINKDYIIKFQNDLLQERFGDKVGVKCHVAYMGLERPCDLCSIQEAIRTGNPTRMELAAPNGRNYELSSSSFTDVDGEVKVIELVKDITERKRTEDALRKNEEESRKLARENAAMAEIGRIISSTLNINEVYEQFGEEVRKVIPFDRIAITIIDHERGTFYNAYILGDDVLDRRSGGVISLAGSLTEGVLRRRSSQLIQTEDRAELAGRLPALLPFFDSGIRSFMAVPLISKNQVIGVLHIFSTKSKAYTETDANLTENISAQIAGAIANSQLYAELKRSEEEQKRLVIQLQDALANIKTLHGLIPICASCKKIRDDKGYWNQIESYIRDHSEAEFSHGICPECMKKLYPDFSNEE